MPTEDEDAYVPAARVCPPRSAPGICEAVARELAALYAVRASCRA